MQNVDKETIERMVENIIDQAVIEGAGIDGNNTAVTVEMTPGTLWALAAVIVEDIWMDICALPESERQAWVDSTLHKSFENLEESLIKGLSHWDASRFRDVLDEDSSLTDTKAEVLNTNG